MPSKQELVQYFNSELKYRQLNECRIGMEVETQFLDHSGRPITVATSQAMISAFVKRHGWYILDRKGELITEIRSAEGDKILYELGRHNIELGTAPDHPARIIGQTREILDWLYVCARYFGAFPAFYPIVETDEDLLVIPDERDQRWVELDGRPALNLLTRCSAVQFTLEAPDIQAALTWLCQLYGQKSQLLADYRQDYLWRRYIAESTAKYDVRRYGDPGFPRYLKLEQYCEMLAQFPPVSDSPDISLFLRSIWWYFRLRRYGSSVCIEVRPLPRRHDDQFQRQLDIVLAIAHYRPPSDPPREVVVVERPAGDYSYWAAYFHMGSGGH